MSMISNFYNLGLENNGLVDKCAVYKATLKLSVQTSCGFQWFKSRTSSQDQETKNSQKKNFEKKMYTFNDKC